MKNKLIFTALFILLTTTVIQVSAQENAAENKTGSNAAENSAVIKPDPEFEKFLSIKPAVESPDELLSLTPEKAITKLGAPKEIFSMRGEREWQDDVVFIIKTTSTCSGLKTGFGSLERINALREVSSV